MIDEIDPYDNIPVEHVTSELRRSRKERKCTWCNTTIAVGDRYRREVDKVDGQIQALDACLAAPNCQHGDDR